MIDSSPDVVTVSKRRAKAALKAAFVIAAPSLLYVAGSLFFGLPGFGLFIWACFFVPALLGILLVQLPLKILLTCNHAGRGRTYAVVVASNVVATLGMAAALQIPFRLPLILGLAVAAIVASSIWYAFDDSVLAGPDVRYSRGTYRA